MTAGSPDAGSHGATRASLDAALRHPALRAAGFGALAAFLATVTLDLHLPSSTCDYFQHLAAIRALATDLLAPPPPFFAQPYQVHLYTPYHLFWAAVAAATGVGPWTIMGLAAAVNFLLFLLGCRLLARHLLGAPDLDLVSCLALLLFWGTPIWWSGVYSLGELPLQAPYPSFFALALAMILAALFFSAGSRRWWWQGLFALGIAVIFVTHPVTASFLLIFLAAKAIMTPRVRVREIAAAGVVAVGGLLLGLAWPYFSMPTLIRAAAGGADFFGAFDAFYRRPVAQIGPALMGLSAVPLWRRSAPVRLLTVTLAVAAALYAANCLVHGSHVFSRYLVFIAFLLQLLLVAALAALRGTRAGTAALALFLVVAAAAGARQVATAFGELYAPYRDLEESSPPGTHTAAAEYGELRDLEAVVSKGQVGEAVPAGLGTVVMAPIRWAYPLAALSGLRPVAVRDATPTMPNFQRRLQDAELFYEAATSATTREEILSRWGAGYVLVEKARSSAGEGDGPSARPAPGWRPVFAGRRFELYEVVAETSPVAAAIRVGDG